MIIRWGSEASSDRRASARCAPAPDLGPDYQARFDAIYPDLAKEFGVALYPFFLDGIAGDPKFNQQDGLHPTKAGVERIVAGILPAVEALLGGLKPQD